MHLRSPGTGPTLKLSVEHSTLRLQIAAVCLFRDRGLVYTTLHTYPTPNAPSLWVDMIHTNNDRAANMSAHTNTQLSVLRASATALDTHNARASSACGGARPATLWTRPGGSRPPPMRPPASGQANLARRLVDECLAMLNLSSSERAPSSRRECDSCARASGGMVVSRDKRR